MPEIHRFDVTDVDLSVRAWDGTQFVRRCLIAESAATADAKLFINYFDNQDFAAGEDLLLWGRLAMTAAVEVTTENEETLCNYAQNGVAVDRATYETERAKTEAELSCAMPADFFAEPEPSVAQVMFIGVINDASVALSNQTPGYGEIVVSVNNGDIVAGDYSVVAYLRTDTSTDQVVVQTIGGIETVSGSHVFFNALLLNITQTALQQMKADGESVVAFDSLVMSLGVERVEQKPSGDTFVFRSCPLAVNDPAVTGSMLVCSADNATFAVDERLELVADVPLSTDAATIAAAFGLAAEQPCYCYENNGTPMTCVDFDAIP